MMGEANQALQSLGISEKPVAAEELKSYFVAPPRLRNGGSFQTTNYFFGFGKDGRLQFITKNLPDSELSIPEQYAKWAKMKSFIDSNGAYDLATNWLRRLDVDVDALEKTHPHRVTQLVYSPEGAAGANNRAVKLPRYEVQWGINETTPVVWVSIFGPTKQPIHIRQEDISFSRRPKGLVKDPEKLLAIPDSVFSGYSVIEKSNMVMAAAVTEYPKLSFPGAVKTPVRGTRQTPSAIPDASTNRLNLIREPMEIHTVRPSLPEKNLPEKNRPQR